MYYQNVVFKSTVRLCLFFLFLWTFSLTHCVKIVRIRSFLSVFSCIWTEYGKTRAISPYSVKIQENTEKKNSEYGHFSRSDMVFSKTFSGVLNSFFFYFIRFKLDSCWAAGDSSKPAFACSKSKMETTKNVWNLFKVNNKESVG